MAGGVEFFDVEQYKVGQFEKLFYIFIPDAAVAVYADMNPFLFQLANQRDKRFRLKRRLSARESDSAALAEERTLAHGHADDFFRWGRRTAFAGYRVGIGTIQAAEVATLKKNDEP